MRGDRIFGVALGVGAIAGATAVLVHLLRRPTSIPPGSPRERPPSPSPSASAWESWGASAAAAAATAAAPPSLLPGAFPGSLYGAGGSSDPDYPLAIWLPIVSSLISTDYKRVDPRIAMKWMAMESDGAPCAFGRKSQLGPDGQPREIGLGQIYNPDDFKTLGLTALGITPAMFRAYCAPNSQRRTRTLSAKEMEDLVRYTLLAKIDQSMGVADRAVATYGLAWATADYWALVKSTHGWPQILSKGLPGVVKKLGRAPTSWAEFRQELGMDALVKDGDSRSKTYGQMVPKFPLWRRSLDNAEKLARAVADAAGIA